MKGTAGGGSGGLLTTNPCSFEERWRGKMESQRGRWWRGCWGFQGRRGEREEIASDCMHSNGCWTFSSGGMAKKEEKLRKCFNEGGEDSSH